MTGIIRQYADLADATVGEVLDVLGPTIQFISEPEDPWPCLMRGVIPPGGIVPLHSHRDQETFILLSGAMEGLRDTRDGPGWVTIRAGDVFYVPSGARHAFRNLSAGPAVSIVATTATLGRFLREIGTPVREEAPPLPERIAHFARTAARYGYWNATPEENAQVGLSLPFPL